VKAFPWKGNNIFLAALPLIMGTAAFFLVVGPNALSPTNIAWLDRGDPANHYLGWLFFRNSAWSFPVGLNPSYGLEFGNAIVYTDSNPLLAILCKLFAPLLPDAFQYFGIWLLACFVLQAWFGWKLLGLITDSIAVRVLGAGLFVFAPPMLWRLKGHLSLVGHFFVVAALYLALVPELKRRLLAWGALLTTASLVHAYLLVMVASLWIADLAWKTLKRKLSLRQMIIELLAMVLACGITCWQAGYFSVGLGAIGEDYGFFHMNLLSLFDASGWSYVLNDIPEVEGEYEGFNFLGLGVIFLLVYALPGMLAGSFGLKEKIRRFPALLVVLAGLTVYAVSNRVGFGLFWFEYPLPDLVLQAANVFRSSGRVFWPVFYAILFVVIYCIIRGNNHRRTVVLLGLALLIQIADTRAGWTGAEIHKQLMTKRKSTWDSPLVNPFWEEAASRYKKVRWIHPENLSYHWQALASYAGNHGMATDAVYLARYDPEKLKQAQRKAADALQTGKYESNSLYVLDDDAFHQAANSIDTANDLLVRINGFNVLAPGWKKCTGCREPIISTPGIPGTPGIQREAGEQDRHATEAQEVARRKPDNAADLKLPLQSECIFNWAESKFPQFFSPAGSALIYDRPMYYRYYPNTRNYLGINTEDHRVWLFVASVSKERFLNVGPITSYLDLAGCSQ